MVQSRGSSPNVHPMLRRSVRQSRDWGCIHSSRCSLISTFVQCYLAMRPCGSYYFCSCSLAVLCCPRRILIVLILSPCLVSWFKHQYSFIASLLLAVLVPLTQSRLDNKPRSPVSKWENRQARNKGGKIPHPRSSSHAAVSALLVDDYVSSRTTRVT